jgi:hypothetical protein
VRAASRKTETSFSHKSHEQVHTPAPLSINLLISCSKRNTEDPTPSPTPHTSNAAIPCSISGLRLVGVEFSHGSGGNEADVTGRKGTGTSWFPKVRFEMQRSAWKLHCLWNYVLLGLAGSRNRRKQQEHRQILVFHIFIHAQIYKQTSAQEFSGVCSRA